MVSNADETICGKPGEQVTALALRKARAVFCMLEGGESLQEGSPSSAKKTFLDEKPPIIIAADTLVCIDGKVLGKPRDAAQAFAMLKSLSGRWHEVYTGVALVQGDCEHIFADAARVYFHALSDYEIDAYIATGEPFDKAGAYGVQERGSVLVERIEGDFYTVVGLPISRVCRVLAGMGYDCWGVAK
jgi:septum formation protein